MEYMDTRNHRIHGYKISWNTWIQEIMEYMDTRYHEIHGYKKSWNIWI